MNLEKYYTSQLDSHTTQFYSEGPRGIFELRVVITPYSHDGTEQLYNLAFGIWDSAKETINDTIETRNGDTDKILATVATVAKMFLRYHPDGYIFAQGSTITRTRKYQMGIARYLTEIDNEFNLRGLVVIEEVDGIVKSWEWQEFERGVNYYAFLLFNK